MTVHAIDWGDFPTWLSAITTLGALIAAGVVVKVELDRDKAASEQGERSEQADKVAAWAVWTTEGSRVRFHNGSDLPVFGVAMVLVPAVGPEDRNHVLLDELVMPPGDADLVWPDVVYHRSMSIDHRDDWLPTLAFTDASGRRWTRERTGKLNRN